METQTLHQDKGLFALYTSKREADIAITTLKKNGFDSEDISMLAPERSGHRDFVYRQHTQLLQGAILGMVLGFIVGCTLGFFVDMGALFSVDNSVETVNPYIPLANVLWSALIGATLGACCGALAGIGSTMSAARRYAFYLKEGGIVLVVRLRNLAQAKQDSVSRILEKTHGQDINILDESSIWSTIVPEKNRMLQEN